MTLWLNGLAATCAEMLFQASDRSVYPKIESLQEFCSNFFVAFALAFQKRPAGPHEYTTSLTFPFGKIGGKKVFLPALEGQK